MARMIPQVDPETITPGSEGLVYAALEGLPDACVVLHSQPWLRPERWDGRLVLSEGEADFIVLDPRRGLLVLEVKGGEIDLRHRQWWYVRKSGERTEMKDPFRQASRSLHALMDEVEARSGGAFCRKNLAHGYGVVFPSGRLSGDLPLDAQADVIIDATGMEDLPQTIDRVFDTWGRRRPPLSRGALKALQTALLPTLRVVRAIGPALVSEEARLVQLTRQQHTTLMGLFVNKRVLVEGVAGSGKTLLALELAVQRAEQGESVRLLCYNRYLAAWLIERIDTEPRLQKASGAVQVDSFHSLALGLARQAKVEFEVPCEPRAARKFWHSEAAQILEQAAELLSEEHPEALYCDTLIIDEGQDFAEEWWLAIEDLLRDQDRGGLVIFMDQDQRLVARGPGLPLDMPVRFELTTNCRNTRQIARSAARLLQVSVGLHETSPAGEAPRVVRAVSREAQAGLVAAELRVLLGTGGLRPDQVVLLGPAAHGRGALASHSQLGGVPIVTDPVWWRQGKGVLCTTARSFKGLEADVVVLYDLGGLGEWFTVRDLYVAWTRARHRLIVICHGRDTRERILSALASPEEVACSDD